MPHIPRFDHVGVTVADLDAATAFFVGLGLEVEGTGTIDSEFIETVCGIPGAKCDIVMLRPPTVAPRWRSPASWRPTTCPARQPRWPTRWACATSPSRSTTCRAARDKVAADGYGLVAGIGE